MGCREGNFGSPPPVNLTLLIRAESLCVSGCAQAFPLVLLWCWEPLGIITGAISHLCNAFLISSPFNGSSGSKVEVGKLWGRI